MFTNVVRPLLAVILIVVVTAGLAILVLNAWDSWTGQLEIRRLEAQAAADAAAAGLERASGERAFKTAEGAAIQALAEAAAGAVRAQTRILTYYGILTPGGIFLAVVGMAIGAAGIGAVAAIGMMWHLEKAKDATR